MIRKCEICRAEYEHELKEITYCRDPKCKLKHVQNIMKVMERKQYHIHKIRMRGNGKKA